MSNLLQELTERSDKYSSYSSNNKHTWCSGCGDYGILSAIKRALVLEDIEPHEVMLCFDVGCNGNASDKINSYTVHGLHGRVTSLASGIANANSKIKVIATAGDGATFSEGINHLVHSIRNNFNVNFVCHNNFNYGLTIGQASSTTQIGEKMSATPVKVTADPLNTLELVLAMKPSFVARSFSGDIKHITEMLRLAMNHKGFSYLEVLQVCPTFNKATPQEWYWDKIYYLDQTYDFTDIWEARKIAEEKEKIALGLIYKNPHKVEFLKSLPYRQENSTELYEEVKKHTINQLLTEFA